MFHDVCEVIDDDDDDDDGDHEQQQQQQLREFTPLERHDVLNQLVSKIDALTEMYNLEKIKTIGMVASAYRFRPGNTRKISRTSP